MKGFKKAIGKIHLWLGLASGIVVLIVSITGCLFVFQQDISEAIHKQWYFISPEKTHHLPLSLLQQKAQQELGSDHPVNYIITYPRPDRSWEFMTYSENDTSLTYFGEMEYFQSVFLDPYNGAVLGKRDYKYDFFGIVKYIHWSLLLSTRYGQPIVGWSTLIFVVLLVTGLVLWWPRKWNKTERQQSFNIKWKARFKRLNYDLHNVLGFYSLLLALVIALTGMVYSFTWFANITYAVAAGTTTPPRHKEVKSVPAVYTNNIKPIDQAYETALIQLPKADRMGISPAAGTEGVIHIDGYRGQDTYYDFDELQFDQYSGKLLNRTNAKDKNKGERLIAMNYDIHVGAIGGMPGKIIAFIISLICASLPVTGFLVWWGKKRKKKKTPACSTGKEVPAEMEVY